MSCPYMREERGTGLKAGHYKNNGRANAFIEAGLSPAPFRGTGLRRARYIVPLQGK